MELVFWLGIVESKIALLVAATAGDFGGIARLLLLLAFATCGQSDISSSCGNIRHLASFMIFFLLLILLGRLRELLGLKALFGLISLIFSL